MSLQQVLLPQPIGEDGILQALGALKQIYQASNDDYLFYNVTLAANAQQVLVSTSNDVRKTLNISNVGNYDIQLVKNINGSILVLTIKAGQTLSFDYIKRGSINQLSGDGKTVLVQDLIACEFTGEIRLTNTNGSNTVAVEIFETQ